MPQHLAFPKPKTHLVDLPPQVLQRGFWLYVWRVTIGRKRLLYVGRTGDNSSANATSPYQRMGQHLGAIRTQNALRQHLKKLGHEPGDCKKLEFICYGPIHPEVMKGDMAAHLPLRNAVGALEKQLALALAAGKYKVMNKVSWRHDYDPKAWRKVVKAFEPHFPNLR